MFLLPIGSGSRCYAQDDGSVEYKMEFGCSVGLINYLGYYNGSILGKQQPMGSLLVRSVLNPYMTLRADISYGKIAGNYKSPNNYYPFGPEHNTDANQPAATKFSTHIADLSCVYEYNFWAYGTGRDYFRAKRVAPYIFLGLGATYAKPDSQSSLFTAHIPLGAGVKYKIADRLNIGLEWRIHFTLSDKLDGVVDPYGIKSQGAFKNTDGYSMLKLTLTYSMLAKCSTCNPSY